MTFNMNGYHWRVVFVSSASNELIDRTGTRTVATTDPSTLTIYISQELHGEFRNRVLIHELSHAAMLSYYLIDDIHSVVSTRYWYEAEERICNFMADYGWRIAQIFLSLHD